MEPLLTLDETADYLRVNRQTVMRFLDEGTLPFIKVGRQYRFRQADVEALFEKSEGQ